MHMLSYTLHDLLGGLVGCLNIGDSEQTPGETGESRPDDDVDDMLPSAESAEPLFCDNPSRHSNEIE